MLRRTEAEEAVLRQYATRFASLRRNRSTRLGDAPHKPILLLVILDGIERGIIRENRIALTPELVAAFRWWWRLLVSDQSRQERIIYPFRYLTSDGFWELVKDGTTVPSDVLGHPTSIDQLGMKIDFGRLSPDLWELMSRDSSARVRLREALFAAYFKEHAGRTEEIASALPDPLVLEAERLIAEAMARPFSGKALPRHDQRDDVSYVRHYLFPRVVTGLYGYACAVCRLNTRDDAGGAVVDAAHVMPFGRFHNDDPRNGLALCKNHHWGFDRGWFGISDAYTLVISPRLSSAAGSEAPAFVRVGAELLLPNEDRLLPAKEALAWHRKNVLRL